MALRTPAAKIPTHGTDFLGQRFAYDFVRPTPRWWAPYGPPALLHLLAVVSARRFAAWDAPVLAATPGRVIAAADGWPDRRWINGYWELGRLRLGHRFRPVVITAADWRPLTGNYLLIEGADGVALYAHLRQDSLKVRTGDPVQTGDPLGSVGNSGRSSMPHLHFHLMDRPEGVRARGRLCDFAAFERWDGSGWRATRGIPGARERIRSAGPSDAG
jgi:hypothetical protein